MYNFGANLSWKPFQKKVTLSACPSNNGYGVSKFGVFLFYYSIGRVLEVPHGIPSCDALANFITTYPVVRQ